jgi:hypothetical protein
MKKLVRTMLQRLSDSDDVELISWAAPVPSFGNLQRAPIATLGINPSNREFVDEDGVELTTQKRRFHTLRSLQLEEWSHAGGEEIELIVESCNEYFFRNPYNGWFKRLDAIVAATGHSYYDRIFPACHIDLLPFATDSKWGTLAVNRRKNLLRNNADLLKTLIESSHLKLLILNGQSVVSEFELAAGVTLTSQKMPGWVLPRSNGENVPGVAYTGSCSLFAGEKLPRPIKVLGFNHNIQSSFGVTSNVIGNIARWVGQNAGSE